MTDKIAWDHIEKGEEAHINNVEWTFHTRFCGYDLTMHQYYICGDAYWDAIIRQLKPTAFGNMWVTTFIEDRKDAEEGLKKRLLIILACKLMGYIPKDGDTTGLTGYGLR